MILTSTWTPELLRTLTDMPKKGKGKAGPPTQEEIDVEKYRLYADSANADNARLRSLVSGQQVQLEQVNGVNAEFAAEREDLYKYLDAQMLQTSRDRQATDRAMKQLTEESERERSSLQAARCLVQTWGAGPAARTREPAASIAASAASGPAA